MKKALSAHQRQQQRRHQRGRVLRGAKAIASYLFGDAEQFRSVYLMKDELGLFELGGMLAARTDVLDQRLQGKKR